MTCTTPGCTQPQITPATKYALSVVGLTSDRCQACTSELLAQLIAVAEHNREAATV